MSSTITKSEMQAVPKEGVTELQAKAQQTSKQRPQLMRSSSVDKIIKFNAYICSQNYYILPSLLIWLKTSQNALTNTTEKSLTYFKSAVFAAALYKMLEERFNVLFPLGAARWLQVYANCARAVRCFFLRTIPLAVCACCDYVSRICVVLAIYASLAVIGLQFVSCLLLLSSVFVPTGLIFMVCCMYAMGHIGVAAMLHHMKVAAQKDKEGGKHLVGSCNATDNAMDRPKAKPHVLGDRTISNVNLF